MTSEKKKTVTIMGIRHHGPGSARSVARALETLRPDAILIEGPPEADKLISYVRENLHPPVALLSYAPDDLKQASYHPFATFSPEWQALLHATSHGINCRFIDLPQSHWFGFAKRKKDDVKDLLQKILPVDLDLHEDSDKLRNARDLQSRIDEIKADPIGALARAAGYSDGERWWEQVVEQRRGGIDEDLAVFAAISAAMGELRQVLEESAATAPAIDSEEDYEDTHHMNILREAYMRQCIRNTLKDGFENVAVVCGAWHAPALENLAGAARDAGMLKGLPKSKVEVTWIPWTHGRLRQSTGYGAGIDSPGWYAHVFEHAGESTLSWLARVAALLRDADYDASTAQVIDAARLADALAAVRDLHSAGLDELQEATLTTLLAGEAGPLALIREKLLVGEEMGSVPEDLPGTPFTVDFQQQLQKLRIKPEAGKKSLDLDLRKELDAGRSRFFNMLNILEVDWALKEKTTNSRSTFRESWLLHWQPALHLALIEAGFWGRTVVEAATNHAFERMHKLENYAALIELLSSCLNAGLADTGSFIRFASEKARLSSDTVELMNSLPALATLARYGNVQSTDRDAVLEIFKTVALKVIDNLDTTTYSLDDDAARSMQEALYAAGEALSLVNDPNLLQDFRAVLIKLSTDQDLNGLVTGRAARMAFDYGSISMDIAEKLVSFALSRANVKFYSALWLEGFLSGSAAVLIHDNALLTLLDAWLVELDQENFQETLPLVRRGFAHFSAPEKRQIAEGVLGLLAQDRSVATAPLPEPTVEKANLSPLIATLEMLLADD